MDLSYEMPRRTITEPRKRYTDEEQARYYEEWKKTHTLSPEQAAKQVAKPGVRVRVMPRPTEDDKDKYWKDWESIENIGLTRARGRH